MATAAAANPPALKAIRRLKRITQPLKDSNSLPSRQGIAAI
jgi:hypothetical protein